MGPASVQRLGAIKIRRFVLRTCIILSSSFVIKKFSDYLKTFIYKSTTVLYIGIRFCAKLRHMPSYVGEPIPVKTREESVSKMCTSWGRQCKTRADFGTPHFSTPEPNMDVSSQRHRSKNVPKSTKYEINSCKFCFFSKFVVCFQYFQNFFQFYVEILFFVFLIRTDGGRVGQTEPGQEDL